MRALNALFILTGLTLTACNGDEDKPDDTSAPDDTGLTTPDEDQDNDGYTVAQGDCDDTNAAVNPGAEEVCDGVDNDCDTAADEHSAIDAKTWHLDSDGDGFGDPEVTTAACDQPEGYVSDDLEEQDCDDAAADVYPGAAEVPCNGRLEDCQGFDVSLSVPGDHDTLQAAVDAAGDGEIVCVSPGTYAPVLIEHTVVLASYDGAEVTIIDADSADAVAEIRGAPETRLQGFTLRNGRATDELAAGLWVLDSPNTAVVDNRFEDNTGGWSSGGLGVDSSDSVLIQGNHFQGGDAVVGGAYVLDSHGVSVLDNVFQENHSGAGALGVYQCEGLLISDNTFESNDAPRGGGMALTEAIDVEVSNNLFLLNLADDGGGALILQSAGITLHGNTFDTNDASQHGGGLFFEDSTEVELRDNLFVNNIAINGAGVYLSTGSLSAASNTFEGNDASVGGGLYATDALELSLVDNTFTENAAYAGAGLAAIQLDALSLSGDTFEDNDVSGLAAGAYVESSGLITISDVTFRNNHGLDNGALYITSPYGDAAITIEDSSFEGNSSEAYGGAVHILGGAELVLQNDSFDSNSSTIGGAAAVEHVAVVSVSECDFTNNNAPAHGSGGALHVRYGGEVIIRDSLLSDNGAGQGGGAHLQDSDSVAIIETIIQSNEAGDGGGLYTAHIGLVLVSGGEITGNSAAVSGGGIFCYTCSLDLTDANVHDNIYDDLNCSSCDGCESR